MIKKVFQFASFILISTYYFTSCSDENSKPKDKSIDNTEGIKVNEQKLTQRDSLLLEINICGDSLSEGNESSCIVDSQFSPINENYRMYDAFVMQIKFMEEERPVLKTYVYQRNSNRELIKLNEFKAYLVASKKRSHDEYLDILLRFIEKEGDRKFYYNCWFGYSKKQSKYVYKECFSINIESIYGNQTDSYSSRDASDRYKIETNREVEAVLNDLNYLN